jgi:hypothetical protein
MQTSKVKLFTQQTQGSLFPTTRAITLLHDSFMGYQHGKPQTLVELVSTVSNKALALQAMSNSPAQSLQ